MASAISANRLELLQIADAVARDKSIDKSVVLTAMEEAMQRAAKAHYGAENDIKVDIDPKTGETHVSRYLHVVELVENDKTEIAWKMRVAAIPTPRLATSSPKPCRRWISTASMPRTPSR